MANGWTSKIGLGPNIAGDFNNALGKFLDDANSFLSYAGESLFGCKPGGLPQCWYNDGAYGVTTSNPGLGAYYVHLLLPPATDRLIIPDGGVLFEKAVGLRDKGGMPFIQKDGMLEITADFHALIESDGDFIMKLTGKKKEAVVYNVGNRGRALPRDIEISLGNGREISTVIIHEDENSASVEGSWGSADNNRLKEYNISVSADGANYTEIIKGTLSGLRGMKQINFPPRFASRIKFRAVSSIHSGVIIKTFVSANWQYAPMDQEPINYSEPVEISDSLITVRGLSWDAGIPIKQAAVSQKRIYVLDNEENIFLIDRGGTNICAVGAGADYIGISREGHLYAVKDMKAGTLRIRRIEVL